MVLISISHRVISMTFGRPAMISKASSGAVPLPAAVDDEYIPSGSSKEVSQPPDRPSMMAFYAKSLELYEIMNDVLLSLYKPVSDDNAEDIHSFHLLQVRENGLSSSSTVPSLDGHKAFSHTCVGIPQQCPRIPYFTGKVLFCVQGQ